MSEKPITPEEITDKLKEFEKFKKTLEEKREGTLFRPFTDFCSHYALFYDDNGVYVGKKRVPYRKRHFAFKERMYNFLPDDSSFFKYRSLMSTKKFYYYNINNPMPFRLKKTAEPVVDASTYKSILDSDLVKKLNPKKSNLLDLIGGWKGLVILLIVGAVVYYFASGGSLTKTTEELVPLLPLLKRK